MAQVITIDGTEASGKSCVAKLLEQRVGGIHLDATAISRAVTSVAIARVLDARVEVDEGALKKQLLGGSIEYVDDKALLHGSDVTSLVYGPKVDQFVSSLVAKLKSGQVETGAGQVMIQQLVRDIWAGRTVIVEGKCAAQLFPEADLSIHLDATLAARVQRRYEELRDDGVSYEKVLESVKKIDADDVDYKVAAAQNSRVWLITTDEMTPEQVVALILGQIQPPAT